EVYRHAVANLRGPLNLFPFRLLVTHRLKLLLNLFRGNSSFLALKVERTVIAQLNGADDGNLQREMVGLADFKDRGIYFRLCKRSNIMLFERIAIRLGHQFVETFLIDIL